MEASRLSVRPQAVSAMVEDARKMQKQVFEDCKRAGKDPPKYTLLQLIGKGSFGRVYKGKDMQTAAVVAVKIIDIDESDTINPRLADAYGDFIKEVNALTALSEIKARNINNVTEALPVGKAMWMITEYCAGGSVSTLMSPTRPGGLQEKWVIPILREVAEAIRWVHSVKIIHRDIKCGNVLVTEKGEVQLCDFGIASMLETKIDKRKTVIGTPNWMAPELFEEQVTYGQDIDIWAFGAMAFEIATGSPPNAGKSMDQIGRILKQTAPRLESDSYSDGLRSLIAYCLEPIPSARPSIEDVEKHPYILNTASTHPTSSLTQLVKAYKMWEDHGGSRRSLFIPGGAAGPSETSNEVALEEWNFSTTVAFEQEVGRSENPQDVFDAYGTGVELDTNFVQSRPNPYKGRRRPPPQSLPQLRHPIEVVFDPNTISNYKDNSAQQYGINQQPSSDLPLRDDSSASIVDTMIDLGGHDPETGLSSFPDMDTIKASRRGHDEVEDEYNAASQDFTRPALSDPELLNNNRRTQDWKFPSMAPPASADPEISRFPAAHETPRPSVTLGSGGRPTLVHHPTEPVGGAFPGSTSGTNVMDRMSMNSLIDLDMSMPDPIDYSARPSTANSDVGSVTSEQTSSRNPFEFERHASRILPQYDGADDPIDTGIYVAGDMSLPLHRRNNNASRDFGDASDFSASDIEGSQANGDSQYYSEASDSEYVPMPPPPRPETQKQHRLPQPPSAAALSGEASDTEMSSEFHRMIDGLTDQLQQFRQAYEGMKPTTITRRPSQDTRVRRRYSNLDADLDDITVGNPTL
ncbi:serine threonine-protein kinase nak1 [Phlyctema vagabunda]|uniref:non-specific serine/threonine protein kinase n=1 Tax=Phlyctema vagabunda TaxID=108571 RepID=A0ABR4P7D7_9HELO